MYSFHGSLPFKFKAIPSGQVFSTLLMPSEPLGLGVGLIFCVGFSSFSSLSLIPLADCLSLLLILQY